MHPQKSLTYALTFHLGLICRVRKGLTVEVLSVPELSQSAKIGPLTALKEISIKHYSQVMETAKMPQH
jgi:hypothetical protein